MALPHAQSCEVVSLRPLAPRLHDTPTSALIKARQGDQAGAAVDVDRVECRRVARIGGASRGR